MVAADISITVAGTDISDHVIYASARFESQLNAVPGTFSFVVKDVNRTLSFTTGDEITLTIDGTPYFGGYVTQIGHGHAFEADDTTPTSDYHNRYWTLSGVDYNVLFDKRVLRQTTNYLQQIANLAGSTQDGAILRSALATYIDVPTGFDITTYIDDTRAIHSFDTTKAWAWPQQGSTLRSLFDEISKWDGQIYYIDADKNFHFHTLERAESPWGFSDQPNFTSITAGSTYSGATYGFREVEAVEDGSVIVNDALVWGGGALGSGAALFKREQNSASETAYGRWQVAETHFGELTIQAAVDYRASTIVNGPQGTDIYGQQKGLRYPQWQFHFTWHDQDVPKISGVRQHLRAGQLIHVDMNVFGVSKLLPLRTLRISFPSNASDGTTYVRFDGDLGIQVNDPVSLWAYLLKNANRTPPVVVATANDSSTATTYGAYGAFTPSPATDNSTTVFTLPFGYIATTLRVYKNGLIQSPTAYTESNPEAGQFTMTTAPLSTDTLYVTCRTLAV